MAMELEQFSSAAKRWRLLAIILIIVCLSLLIALIAVSKESRDTSIPVCGEEYPDEIDTSEQNHPGVFADLTVDEIKSVQDYLSRQSDLHINPNGNNIDGHSYIYFVDLMLPKKSRTLDYLDSSGPQPERQAKVLIFRRDLSPAVCAEYAVGPLPNPSYHSMIKYSNRRNPVEFVYRPVSRYEIVFMIQELYSVIDNNIGDILLDTFGRKFTNCQNKCLTFYLGTMHSTTVDKPHRYIWMRVVRAVEYFFLHPIDLAFMVNFTSSDPKENYIEKIWLQGKVYESFDEIKRTYNVQSNISITSDSFPTDDKNMFSTINMRGNPKPEKPKSGPRQTVPGGKRYSIHGRLIEYLGWKFNFRVATQTGPQLLDVRYNNDRIVYEIGIQEITVYHSGSKPDQRHANYIDGLYPLASNLLPLVPGVDCPEEATFLNVTKLIDSNTITTYPSAVCVFEHNNGIPLRRHTARGSFGDPGFYAGMPDNVLIVRTCLVIGMDNYITDFIFHQGGALEVKFTPTGYLSTTFYTNKERSYSFKLRDNLAGNIHFHSINYKVDVDIKGTNNRFETLDIDVEDIPNNIFPGNFQQLKFKRDLKKTELEAAYKFDFNTPKYLLFHNKKEERSSGTPKSYRLLPVGVAKQLIPVDSSAEGSVSWTRYQVAVTKFKDDELSSSSPYAQWDGYNPVIKFQRFLDDNETIVDQDLVAWVTLSTHHIPRTEDLPTTTTVGGHLQFFLLPYNYFEEDASLSSRDAVRYEIIDNDRSKGVHVERNGLKSYVKCVAKDKRFDETVKNSPSLVFGEG